MEATENKLLAPVNKIIPFSDVDGPGNRTAIFFQSCPFSCLYCHNPETIKMCVNCGVCVNKCPVKALFFVDGKVKWNKDKCVNCDTCIHVCPNLSSPKITYMSVSDILSFIKKVRPFIRGITVSGGECMNQAPFLFELFSALREEEPSLSLLIDSNGNVDYRDYEPLIRLSDGVMLDVKAYDEEFHRMVCGESNEIVLQNLNYLLSIDKLEEVRTVILPYQEKENEYTVSHVARIIGNRCHYKLLKYRYFGVREAGLKMFGKGMCPEEELLRCQKIAFENGCETAVII